MTNILNPQDVQRFCDDLSERASKTEIKEWVRHTVRNHLLRTAGRHLQVLSKKPSWAPYWAESASAPFHQFKPSDELRSRIEHLIDWAEFNFDGHNIRQLRRMTYQVASERADEWHNALIRVRTDEQERDVETVMSFADGYRIVRLADRRAYYREGRLMNHCVGGFYYNDSGHVIYSLRDRNNLPHITMQVTPLVELSSFTPIGRRLTQCKGKGNRLTSVKYLRYLAKFFDHLSIDVKGCEDVAGLFIGKKDGRLLTVLDLKPAYEKNNLRVVDVGQRRYFFNRREICFYWNAWGDLTFPGIGRASRRQLREVIRPFRFELVDYLNKTHSTMSTDFEHIWNRLGMIRDEGGRWNDTDELYPPEVVFEDTDVKVVRQRQFSPRRYFLRIYHRGDQIATAYANLSLRVYNMSKHSDQTVMVRLFDILTNQLGMTISPHVRRQYMVFWIDDRNLHADAIHPRLYEYLIGVFPFAVKNCLIRHSKFGFVPLYEPAARLAPSLIDLIEEVDHLYRSLDLGYPLASYSLKSWGSLRDVIGSVQAKKIEERSPYKVVT